MATAPLPLLQRDDDLIERLEKDLIDKATAAFAAATLTGGVYGVFSLDQLETLNEADFCRHIAVGIGYMGCEPTPRDSEARTGQNPGSSNAARLLDFIFAVVLAVPTGEQCTERYDATKVLTILRKSIMGTPVTGDVANRKWMFAREFPNVSESTSQMLYYSQMWRIAIVNVGNQ